MESIETTTDAGRRLAATGSREPAWNRLPEEPPFADSDPAALPTQRITPLNGPPAPPAKRRGGGWLQTILAAVLGAALALVGFQLLDNSSTTPVDEALVEPIAATNPNPVATPIPLEPGEAADAAGIGTKVIPSIVTVQVGEETPEGVAIQGSGSGVILDTEGHIATNDHVISSGTSFQVVLSDGRTTYSATLIGTDPLTDLAILKIDAPNLQPIELGATTVLRVGDTAVAVGSPLGLQGGPSLTVGVVSAFGRQVQVSAAETLYGMLQTDAPITQGSSGGALVDSQGRLIGITTAVGVSDVGIEGIGFATPVELVERVTTELIMTGAVEHAFLGIIGATSFATSDDGAEVAVGVEVDSVELETGASVGGVGEGDLITAVDGEAVTTMDDLILALRYREAGDTVTLTVSDDAGPRTLNITLGERP